MSSEQSSPRIFVSHTRHDDAFGLRLIADLRACFGEDAIWYDSAGGIRVGDRWVERIFSEIASREIFLVILSPAALATSKWVPEEMTFAYRLHVELSKHLLPIRYQDGPTRPEWAGIQELNFTSRRPYTDALSELIAALKLLGMIERPHAIVSLPAASEIPRIPAQYPQPVIDGLIRDSHTAYHADDWSSVLDKTDLLIECGAMDTSLWRERIVAALAREATATALAATEHVLLTNPADLPALHQKARALISLGYDKEATDTLTLALQLAPLDSATQLPLLVDLTNSLQRQKRWPELERRLADGARLAPDDPSWQARRMKVLWILGRGNDVLRLAHDILRANSIFQTRFFSSMAARDGLVAREAWDAYLQATQEAGLVVEGLGALAYADRAGVAPDQLRRWRERLPSSGALLHSCIGHIGPVNWVAWSPDGTRLASAGSDDRLVRVWDTTIGEQVFVYSGHTGLVRGVVWSPDGTRLASAADDTTVRVWNAANGEQRALGMVHPSFVYGVAWSPDGERLATAGFDRIVRVWDAQNGKQLNDYVGHGGPVNGVTWSPDGRLLASAGSDDELVRIWNVQAGQQVCSCSGHDGPIYGVAWSPDGMRLASGGFDGTVRIWDASHGNLLFVYLGHNAAVNGVAWSPDGMRLASASEDQKIHIWNTQTGQLLLTCSSSESTIYSVAWSPDGLCLASAHHDQIVRIWIMK